MGERIKSGIRGLDELIDGGLLRKATVTLSGPSGSGKSTFGMQFLVNGAELYREPGIYIAIEETKESMYKHMKSYRWDLKKLERNNQLLFLDYPPREVEQFLFQKGVIEEFTETIGAERVVLDSVMPIALLFKTEEERKSGFLRLLDAIKRWKTTTILITEDTPTTTQDILPRTMYGIETLTDAWIHLYYLYTKKGERKRAMEIVKMKGTKHTMGLIDVEMDEEGFKVIS